MKLSYTFVFLFFISSLFSQNAETSGPSASYKSDVKIAKSIDESSIIKGTVIEEATGKPLPGALVVIIGTKFSTLTDSEGKFYFRKMPAGKYNLEFSLFSFGWADDSDRRLLGSEA